jgi:hypothetical protein
MNSKTFAEINKIEDLALLEESILKEKRRLVELKLKKIKQGNQKNEISSHLFQETRKRIAQFHFQRGVIRRGISQKKEEKRCQKNED